MPQEPKTSKQVVLEYFPNAKSVVLVGPPSYYAIEWSGVYLTKESNRITPTQYLTEEEAWDNCIKNKLLRERFLSIQHGKLITFLNDCDDAIPLYKPPIKDDSFLNEPVFKDITIEEVTESFTQARDW